MTKIYPGGDPKWRYQSWLSYITQNSFPFVSFDKEGIVNVFIKTVLPWFSNIYNERQSTTKFPKPDNIKHSLKNHVSIHEFAHRELWLFAKFVHWYVTRHFPVNEKLDLENRPQTNLLLKNELLNAAISYEKQTNESYQIFIPFNNMNI